MKDQIGWPGRSASYPPRLVYSREEEPAEAPLYPPERSDGDRFAARFFLAYFAVAALVAIACVFSW